MVVDTSVGSTGQSSTTESQSGKPNPNTPQGRATLAQQAVEQNKEAGLKFEQSSTPANEGSGYGGGRVSFTSSGGRLVDNQLQVPNTQANRGIVEKAGLSGESQGQTLLVGVSPTKYQQVNYSSAELPKPNPQTESILVQKVLPIDKNQGKPVSDKSITDSFPFGTSAKNYQISINEYVGIGESGTISKGGSISSSKSVSNSEFNAFLSGVESRGGTVDIFTSSGAKIGTVKPDTFGKGIITDIVLSQPGSFVQETRNTSNITKSNQQNRLFADYIAKYGSQGATINLFSGGKKVGSVSGPNAYRETIITSRQYPQGLSAQVEFSTTREGKQLSSSLITKANAVGASSIDVFFQGKGGKPELIKSIPISKAQSELPQTIENYAGNKNVFFSTTPSQIKNPKETTSIPATILPLELDYLNSKENTGKYFNLEQYAGKRAENIKYKSSLPVYPVQEKSIGFNLPFSLPSTAFHEAGQETLALATGFIKSTPPFAAGVGTEFYNLIITGKSNFFNYRGTTTPKAIASSTVQRFLYPQDFFSPSALENYEKTSTFIHANIGVPIREFGITTPQRIQQPKSFGSFVGTTVGYGMMIPPEVVPIRIGKIPLKVKPETPSPAFPSALGGEKSMVSGSIILGYGGAKTTSTGEIVLSGKELISKTASGYKVGEVKPENILPQGYQISAKATRGEEFGTATPYAVSKLSSEKFLSYAESTGRAVKGTSEIVSLLKETKTLVTPTGEYTKYEQSIPITTEKITPVVGKAVLESNAKLSGVVGKINFMKGSGIQQGSTITKIFTKPEIAKKVFTEFPAQDIDIRVGNPIAGRGGGFFGFLSERQARAQASTAQSAIETAQGIKPEAGVGFHATSTLEEARSISKNPSTEESKRGGFFVMNKASDISQFGSFLVKIKFNENDVLRYKNIPKGERKRLIPRSESGFKDWLQYQQNVQKSALSKGFNIVEKPYYNTKKGAGTNPNAPVKEIIFINPQSLKSIKSIEVLPKLQITKTEGSKIIDVKTGEKLVEYTTEKDTENEIASTLKPQGTILGKPINYQVYKTKITGSRLKGPHFGGQYQEETGLSQILSFQTKETLEQQQSSNELITKIGSKFFVGPKAFGGGKELVRTFALFETKAAELKANPSTYEVGLKIESNVARLKELYGNLYDIDFNKPIQGSAYEPPSSYWISGKTSKGSNYVNTSRSLISSAFASRKSFFSSKSFIKSKESKLSKISKSSSKSSVSRQSFFSDSSKLSSKSSLSSKSGTSGKSGLSSSSNISKLSNLSSKSGLSSSSTPPSQTSSSLITQISQSSLLSSSSSTSSSSSALSIPPSTIPGGGKKLPSILIGNIGRRRKNKTIEKSTGLINLDVNNIFASGLSIKVAPNKKYEFS